MPVDRRKGPEGVERPRVERMLLHCPSTRWIGIWGWPCYRRVGGITQVLYKHKQQQQQQQRRQQRQSHSARRPPSHDWPSGQLPSRCHRLAGRDTGYPARECSSHMELRPARMRPRAFSSSHQWSGMRWSRLLESVGADAPANGELLRDPS